MAQPEIKAEKINSPIQLMAAWFVMLILLTGVLLAAASNIQEPKWASGYLVISATILIVFVLVAVFLMLTVFRPNLQSGKEYAQWLKDQNTYTEGVVINRDNSQFEMLRDKIDSIKESLTKESDKKAISLLEDTLLYSVSIINKEGASLLQDRLSHLGVKSKIHRSRQDLENEPQGSDSIWLGKKVPAKVAVPVIMEAFKVWPNLKYVSLPTENAPEEVQWNIFIGGASKTSIRRGYGEWSKADFDELSSMDTEQIHRKLAEKNS